MGLLILELCRYLVVHGPVTWLLVLLGSVGICMKAAFKLFFLAFSIRTDSVGDMEELAVVF